MLPHHRVESGLQSGRGRVFRGAAALSVVIGFAGASLGFSAAALGGLGVSAAGAAHPAQSGPSCTFTLGAQSVVASATTPAPLTGVTNGQSVGVSCTGLNSAHSYGVFQASPLAVVTQPFSLTVLGSEADINTGIGTLGSASAGGIYNASLPIGTSAAGSFSSGGTIAGSPPTVFASDPKAVCPPTQAEVNAGLGACVVAVADITATVGLPAGSPATPADFVGEALLDFSGQPTPQVPPTVSFNPPVVAPGHSAILTDTGATTNWWGGGWWGGGYQPGTLVPAPDAIPSGNIFLNGAPAPAGASAQITPAVYCFYGGPSSSSCNGGTADTPGAGVIFPSSLSGSVPVPSGTNGASATVTIYQSNVWGSVFPGNSTNSSFANDVTATGGVAITHIGYWEVASDGGLFSFGTANFYGSEGGQPINAPVVGMAATPDSGGYWEVASDGGLFSFGDAAFFGSMGGKPLNKPIVSMTATPDGGGYWEVASDGGLFAFGDAAFYGSMGGKPLNKPIIDMAATPDGGGYWEVASDGGLFAFGDAAFYGSEGGKPLNAAIVGMAATPDGGGYWEVGTDGGLFAFGDAGFFGSMGGQPLNKPIVAMWSTQTGNGYWLAASDGGIFAFGGAAFLGSMGGMPLNKPVVSGTLAPVPPTTSLSLTKSTSSSGYGAAGNVIPYSYVVTNTGETTLSNVAIADTKTTVSCPTTTLTKGAGETCTSSYTITQADVDGGSVTNSATATATDPHANVISSTPAVVTVAASHATTSLSIHGSTPSAGYGAAGEVIPYSFVVRNTGTTTVNNVMPTMVSTTNALAPVATPVSVTCPAGNVAPGASVSCVGTYTVEQPDIDNTGLPPDQCAINTWGSVTSAVSAQATNLAGLGVTSSPSAVEVCGKFYTASFTVSDTPSPLTYGSAASPITYTYVVTNTGTVALSTLSVQDIFPATTITATCPDGGTDILEPGQNEACTLDYLTTANDVTNLSVTDTVLASMQDQVAFNSWSAWNTATINFAP